MTFSSMKLSAHYYWKSVLLEQTKGLHKITPSIRSTNSVAYPGSCATFQRKIKKQTTPIVTAG